MTRVGKIGVEIEYPAIDETSMAGLPQEKFQIIWEEFCQQGWEKVTDPVNGLPTGVFRQIKQQDDCLSSTQALSTDTGPLLEIATSPEENLFGLEKQLQELRSMVSEKLILQKGAILGLGIHPLTSDSKAEYYRLRTPRSAYDYAINERGWPHWKLLNVAAI